jgi:hypothetical protein
MAQVDGRTSIPKTNLYRAGVDMPPVNPATDTGLAYCRHLADVAPKRLEADRSLFSAPGSSPDTAAGATLFDFLTQRFAATWTNLGCQTLTGQATPSVGTTPANGTAGTADTNGSPAAAPATADTNGSPAADPAAAGSSANAAPPGADGASAQNQAVDGQTDTAAGPTVTAGPEPGPNPTGGGPGPQPGDQPRG